jgi:hypothetical protein
LQAVAFLYGPGKTKIEKSRLLNEFLVIFLSIALHFKKEALP